MSVGAANMKNCSMEMPQKIKIELLILYNPATPFLGIYLKKKMWKDISTPMFIAALFIIVNIWKEAKCPSTDE